MSTKSRRYYLYKPSTKEGKVIEKKSPITAERIKECIAKYKEETDKQNKFDQLDDDILSLADSPDPDLKQLYKKNKEFINLCMENNAYWRLCNLGESLAKTSIIKDFSWSLYNSALQVMMKVGANLSGVYALMGYLRKKENSYYDATKLFIIAYSEWQNKEYENQIRICLKKMGFKDTAEKLRDRLINIVKEEGRDKALMELESLRKKDY